MGEISGYPDASTPLSGTEGMIGTQSGATVQVTVNDIAAFVGGAPGLKVVVTPETFGAVGDGATDDTTAINAWIAAINAGGNCLAACNPGKTYIFSGGLNLTASGFTILGNGATLKVKNSTAVDGTHYGLQVTGGLNYAIYDLIVDGNRANRTPSVSFFAQCFGVWGGAGGRFVRCQGINAVFDGWYIGPLGNDNSTIANFTTDTTFEDCVGLNAYRNSMSIINSLRCRVVGGRYDNANGSSPQAGIDVEPNGGTATPANDGLVISGVTNTGNLGDGFSVNATVALGNITLRDIIADGTGAGNVSSPFLFNGDSLHVSNAIGRNYSNSGSQHAVQFACSVLDANLRLVDCTGYDRLVSVNSGTTGYVSAIFNGCGGLSGLLLDTGVICIDAELSAISTTVTSGALLQFNDAGCIGRILANGCTGNGVFIAAGSSIERWDFTGHTWGVSTTQYLMEIYGYQNSVGPGSTKTPACGVDGFVFASDGGNLSECFVSDDMRLAGCTPAQISVGGSIALGIYPNANITVTSITKTVAVADTIAGNITVTLPLSTACTPGQKFLTIRNRSLGNTTLLAAQGGDTLVGNASVTANTTALVTLDSGLAVWERVL